MESLLMLATVLLELYTWFVAFSAPSDDMIVSSSKTSPGAFLMQLDGIKGVSILYHM